MKRTRIHILTLSHPDIEAVQENKALANRVDEAVLFGCELVIEVLSLLSKNRRDYALFWIGKCSDVMYELTKTALEEFGIATDFVCDFKTEHAIQECRVPKDLQMQSGMLKQLTIAFGFFGPNTHAESWHKAEFVDRVGSVIGEGLTKLFSVLQVSSVGIGFAHSAPSMLRRKPTKYEMACQRKYGCSRTSHERDFLKAILKHAMSILSQERSEIR